MWVSLLSLEELGLLNSSPLRLANDLSWLPLRLANDLTSLPLRLANDLSSRLPLRLLLDVLDLRLGNIGLSKDLRLNDLLDDLLLLRLVDDLFGDWDVFDVLDLSLLRNVLSGISGLRNVLGDGSLDWNLLNVGFLLRKVLSDGGVVHLRNILDLVLNGIVVSNLSGDWDLLNFLDGFVVSVNFLDWNVLGDGSLLIILVLSGVWDLLELGLSSERLFKLADLRLLDNLD